MRKLLQFALLLFSTSSVCMGQANETATSIGSDKFKTNSSKQFWMGSNYRKEWKTPITVPILHLATEHGGLKPVKRGGGKQTKSLRLEDASGRQYSLRSIQKFITSKTLPGGLDSEAAADLVADGVSASYPYSALSIPPIAKAAGVPYGNVRLVYIPDDPLLGEYREDFKNMLALLEERLPEPYSKADDSEDVLAKLKDDNDNSVDQLALLKIRILDMFVMDLDRHEGQWTWTTADNDGKGKTFLPIAKDRDQAFYTNQGVIPGIAKWPWLVPQLEGLKAQSKNINRFNFAARNFDRFFLNELSEQQWKETAEKFKSQMTDAVLEEAINLQPKEIRDISGNKILGILKERRNYIIDEVMQYYRFLAETVSVTGSDKKELFELNNSNGSSTLTVYKINKEGEQSTKMYERSFSAGQTKELRLYGFDGDDKFVVKGGDGDIKVRMIGGAGDDSFENTGGGKGGIVYDAASESNKVSGSFKNKISNDTSVNKYDFLGFKYNQTIPFISANFNSDDGVFLGLSLKFIRHGFRKDPYKTMHTLAINHAFATNAWNFRWGSEFIGALGKNSDILFDADIKSPSTTTNFYGYGITSVFDKSNTNPETRKFRYYRARYSLGDISLLIRKNFSRKVNITVGPVYQYFHLEQEDNFSRYITTAPANGLDPATLYAKQSYAGGLLTLNINTKNMQALPTRGVTWNTSLKVLRGLTDESNDVTQLRSDFAFFVPLGKNVVLASRFGAGANFGDFEFYQAQYLGALDNLRGYRKFRFAGESMAFNNTELRIRFGDFRSYLFPGSIGMVIFHDAGHVWHDSDGSTKWVSGYGGGLWVSPMKRFVITALFTASKESKLPLIGFGWQF
jgi:Omp85 superfamily domain